MNGDIIGVPSIGDSARGVGHVLGLESRLELSQYHKAGPHPINRGDKGEVVLVTGATGFIGEHVVLQLLRLGYKVRAAVPVSTEEYESGDCNGDAANSTGRHNGSTERTPKPALTNAGGRLGAKQALRKRLSRVTTRFIQAALHTWTIPSPEDDEGSENAPAAGGDGGSVGEAVAAAMMMQASADASQGRAAMAALAPLASQQGDSDEEDHVPTPKKRTKKPPSSLSPRQAAYVDDVRERLEVVELCLDSLQSCRRVLRGVTHVVHLAVLPWEWEWCYSGTGAPAMTTKGTGAGAGSTEASDGKNHPLVRGVVASMQTFIKACGDASANGVVTTGHSPTHSGGAHVSSAAATGSPGCLKRVVLASSIAAVVCGRSEQETIDDVRRRRRQHERERVRAFRQRQRGINDDTAMEEEDLVDQGSAFGRFYQHHAQTAFDDADMTCANVSTSGGDVSRAAFGFRPRKANPTDRHADLVAAAKRAVDEAVDPVAMAISQAELAFLQAVSRQPEHRSFELSIVNLGLPLGPTATRAQQAPSTGDAPGGVRRSTAAGTYCYTAELLRSLMCPSWYSKNGGWHASGGGAATKAALSGQVAAAVRTASPSSMLAAVGSGFGFGTSKSSPRAAAAASSPRADSSKASGGDASEAEQAEKLERELRGDVVADVSVGVLDVQDAAKAAILAMTSPLASAERYLCCARSVWLGDLAEVLAEEFRPMGMDIPAGTRKTRTMPYAAMLLPTPAPGLTAGSSGSGEYWWGQSLPRRTRLPRVIEQTHDVLYRSPQLHLGADNTHANDAVGIRNGVNGNALLTSLNGGHYGRELLLLNTKATTELGLHYRPIEASLVRMAHQLIEESPAASSKLGDAAVAGSDNDTGVARWEGLPRPLKYTPYPWVQEANREWVWRVRRQRWRQRRGQQKRGQTASQEQPNRGDDDFLLPVDEDFLFAPSPHGKSGNRASESASESASEGRDYNDCDYDCDYEDGNSDDGFGEGSTSVPDMGLRSLGTRQAASHGSGNGESIGDSGSEERSGFNCVVDRGDRMQMLLTDVFWLQGSALDGSASASTAQGSTDGGNQGSLEEPASNGRTNNSAGSSGMFGVASGLSSLASGATFGVFGASGGAAAATAGTASTDGAADGSTAGGEETATTTRGALAFVVTVSVGLRTSKKHRDYQQQSQHLARTSAPRHLRWECVKSWIQLVAFDEKLRERFPAYIMPKPLPRLRENSSRAELDGTVSAAAVATRRAVLQLYLHRLTECAATVRDSELVTRFFAPLAPSLDYDATGSGVANTEMHVEARRWLERRRRRQAWWAGALGGDGSGSSRSGGGHRCRRPSLDDGVYTDGNKAWGVSSSVRSIYSVFHMFASPWYMF
jgi:hypothetical protein